MTFFDAVLTDPYTIKHDEGGNEGEIIVFFYPRKKSNILFCPETQNDGW
jgi:hypothetical protein